MTRVLVPRRRPEALLLEGRPDDVLLLPGELPPPLPSAARLVDRYELLPPADRHRIVAAVPPWLAAVAETPAARRLADGGVSPVELAAGEEVPALLEALALGILLARLADLHRPREWIAGSPWPALRHALAGAGIDPARVRPRREPRWRLLLRGGPGLPRNRARQRGAGSAVVPPPRRLLLLEGGRTSPLGDDLEAAGIPLARLAPGEENHFFPGVPPPPTSLDGSAWARLLRDIPEPPDLPGAPGFSARRVLASLLGEALPRAAVRLGQVRAWRALLRDRRPPGVVAGLPWQGDLRALAFAARAEGIPFVAVQDGALGWTGIGAILPPTAALAWGPEGKRWFLARGFDPDRVLETGDPLLDRRAARVRSLDPRKARRALGLPARARVLLAGLANSAPHDVHSEEDTPLAVLRGIGRGARDAGWVLLVKPHPRLPRVDGLVRLAEAREQLRGIPARLLSPDEDLARALAAADAWISDGDTVTLEALAAGRPAILWAGSRAPCPYPDFADGDLPRAEDPAALARILRAGPPVAPAEVLGRHVRPAIPFPDAVARLVPAIDSAV